MAIDWSKSYWVPPPPPVLVPLDEVLAMFGYTREELEALPDDD